MDTCERPGKADAAGAGVNTERVRRRDFVKLAGAGVAGALVGGAPSPGAAPDPSPARKMKVRTRDEKLGQIASNSYAVHDLFKWRYRPGPSEWKERYGEITLLDFPRFTRDTYPGVTKMDIWSSLFGDMEDPSQFTERSGRVEFDPESDSGKRYLDRLVARMAQAGVYATHISNNAPRHLASPDESKREEGIRCARVWVDCAKTLGCRSMRLNTGGPVIIPAARMGQGYPEAPDVVPHIRRAIDSFKRVTEYGAEQGVRITIENHWGLSSDPMIIRAIIQEVGNPFLEASPDFCNWLHEYLLYHGLEVLVPLAHSMCHAKRWTRFPDVDIARCVRILNDGHYDGYISLEYEAGGDQVQGTLKLLEDVLGALA